MSATPSLNITPPLAWYCAFCGQTLTDSPDGLVWWCGGCAERSRVDPEAIPYLEVCPIDRAHRVFVMIETEAGQPVRVGFCEDCGQFVHAPCVSCAFTTRGWYVRPESVQEVAVEMFTRPSWWTRFRRWMRHREVADARD